MFGREQSITVPPSRVPIDGPPKEAAAAPCVVEIAEKTLIRSVTVRGRISGTSPSNMKGRVIVEVELSIH